MAKIGKLTALAFDRLKEPGKYADGGGLYLQVTRRGETAEPAKSWILRFMLKGKPYEMGLGSLSAVTLKLARERAAHHRLQVHDGINPIEARRLAREATVVVAERAVSFKTAAEQHIEGHKAGWRNAKHAAQWTSTLETYAFPIIGDVPVRDINVDHLMKVLTPIWSAKTETANRVRQRIESILDAAKVRNLREGENPARWRGHLNHLLPAPGSVSKVKHHAALPYPQTPAFVAALRALEGVAARALEFLVLIALRTDAVRRARWSEIDFQSKIWTVPAVRLKSLGEELRVPLTDRAMAILREMENIRQGDYVFPGENPSKYMANDAMRTLVRDRMGIAAITPHGFRSAMKDWAHEETVHATEVVEKALAHKIDSKVEAAYRRGALFEKRRAFMNDWAMYCDGHDTNDHKVVNFTR